MNKSRNAVFTGATVTILLCLSVLNASDFSERYSGDDAYIVSGTGSSNTGVKSPLQAESTVLQSARVGK